MGKPASRVAKSRISEGMGRSLFRFPTTNHAAMAPEMANVGAGGHCGDAGDAGAAPSRLRRPRDSERAVAGRRGGGATPVHCGWFAMAKFNVAGVHDQYGGGPSRRKSSSAAFMVAMACAA